MTPNADPSSLNHTIEVRVRTINQLFDTMDPSPFIEKDLDPDAEEFIVSWAREKPKRAPLSLNIHILERPGLDDFEGQLTQSINNYFAYRAGATRNRLRELMRRGRTSALIGLCFLALCLFVSEQVRVFTHNSFGSIVAESFIIIGWVAMWRPLEIFLYDWWPLAASIKLYKRLSVMPMRVMPGWV